MGLDFAYINGQTPLDEDDKEGLRIPSIATRSELDEFEQQNIEEAVQWSMQRSFNAETVFTETFIRTLHKRMYGDVWSWAGEFRKTNKNIVSIHCFPNGNGRHGRLLADILIERVYKLPALTWGSGSMMKPGGTRAIYLNAMRAADKGNITPLLRFARS